MFQQAESPTSSPDRPRIGLVGPFQVNTVHLQDCVDGMRQIPSNSIDLVIADPPYNVSKGAIWKWDNSVNLKGFGGDWSKFMAQWDNMPLADYLNFTISWLAEAKRIVRPTGSIWVHGTYHNSGIINLVMQLLQIEIINEVVWYKRNSFPNLSGRRLTASHETIIWAHTGGQNRRYYFNYEAAKAMDCPGDALKKPGRQMRTVWDIPNNKESGELIHGKHPAQKPLRLLRRMLEISAERGSLVLVPFAGSGSECVAAKQLGSHFLGFENDPTYFDICNKRLGESKLGLGQSPYPVNSADVSGIQQRMMLERKSARSIPPLIKWTGGKRSQAHTIASHIPEHKRYFEPFLGAGALLYLVGRPGSVAADIYDPLIQLWKAVQTSPETVIDDYSNQWASLQANLPGYYYEVRDRFNENPNALDLNFLVRTCVNGIIRFSHSGKFNNSFHLSRRGMQPERFAAVVENWHKALQGVKVLCQDYQDTLQYAQEGDFVYLDPPYAGNNMRYTSSLDLDRFFLTLEELNSRDVKWALSFDGWRGETDLRYQVPEHLYVRQLSIPSGNSPVGKVLNGPVEPVLESLYLNY